LITTGAYAIADQLLFAGGNLAVGVFAARELSANGYGGFAVAYSMLLLLGLMHTALITEPLLIFGATRYRARYGLYVGAVTIFHFGLTVPVGFAVVLTGAVVAACGDISLGLALIGLGLSLPLVLALWMLRRALYVVGRSHVAAAGGVIYLASLASLGLVIHRSGAFTGLTVFAVMAGSSAVVGAWLLHQLQPRWQPRGEFSLRRALRAHWGYGRWSAAGAAVNWMPVNLYYLALPCFGLLGQVGYLNVAITLVMAVVHVLSALSLLLLSRIAIAAAAGDVHQLRRAVSHARRVFVGLALAFAIVVGVAGSDISGLVFGPRYASGGGRYLFVLIAVAAIPIALGILYQAVLRGLQLPRSIFQGYGAGAAVTVAVGLPLAYEFGASGAVAGICIAGVPTIAILSRAYANAAQRLAEQEVPT
jgi:O-antigen/teichoic acid export membrane protein